MKTIVKFLLIMLVTTVAYAAVGNLRNPAKGIWITQIGDIVAQEETNATLYYTKYENDDRVKSVDYHYNGAGILALSNRTTICDRSKGVANADGIVHHPDGDLLVAQGTGIFKIKKNDYAHCKVKQTPRKDKVGYYWHLMMDPSLKYVWGTEMPGLPHRHKIYTNGVSGGIDDDGYAVHVEHDSRDRRKEDAMTTIVWDESGNAFFTYSSYDGGGCEENYSACSPSKKKENSAKAYFGVVDKFDKVYVRPNTKDSVTYKAHPGDSAVTKMHVRILLDSLEGAHGATYDPLSKTIFVFGGSKIVQIKPYKENGKMNARVVASIDLREVFFSEKDSLSDPRTPGVGYRLDQGTVDGMGHLFVACQTGYVIFIDYAANENYLINNNVLIHMQWIDNYLDDLAPLDIEDAERGNANTPSKVSSSSVVRLSSDARYEESSSSAKSSSSARSSSSSAKSSSSIVPGSSGSNPGSSGSVLSSSSTNPGSSGSDPTSSSTNPGSSGSDPTSSSTNPGSSGSDPTSSSSNPGSSGSNPGSSGSDPSSSGSNPGSSGSNPGSSNSGSSSSNQGSYVDYDDSSSSGYIYIGFEDYGDELDSNEIAHGNDPEQLTKGDTLVKEAYILEPTNTTGTGTITIGENTYLITDNPRGTKLDLRNNANIDSARVGQVVALTLDPEKVKEYFGTGTTIKYSVPTEGLIVIDPKNPNSTEKRVKVNSDGSVIIYVTADEPVDNGTIVLEGENGQVVVIDNINFFDPVPDSKRGYIKDSDSDNKLDYVEIQLQETLVEGLTPVSVTLIIDGKPITVDNPIVNETRDRVSVSVASVKGIPECGALPENARVFITYKDEDSGKTYERESELVEFGSNIIKEAYAIRNSNGMDSLFVEFNVDLIPYDVRSPEMLILLNGAGFNLGELKKVYLPSKNIVIFEGKGLALKGEQKDSVSLFPMVTFQKMPYITSDEYDRRVPVKVVDRVPAVKNAEYWDRDKNGVLDQIVLQFSDQLTGSELAQIYASFPWYTSRGLVTQLQAQPSDLTIDPEDSTRVIWNVHAATQLAKGVTGISETLPTATVFTYYNIFGETFATEDPAVLVDKMSPVILGATLSYGKKADTLELTFSEAIKYQKLEGRDFFKYIHGKDTLDLIPKDIQWSSDGTSAKLIIDGNATTILPGDSLMVVRGLKSSIQDNYGNIMGENPQPVVIAGLLNHLVENTTMGTFDSEDENLQTLSSVNLRYVPSSTTKEDLEKEGALGQLVQLGERFVPQLLDRAQISADGSMDPSVLDSLNPEDVFISFVVNYFDHLGQYVNDTTITVPCNSPKFGGNCLNTDQKVFVNWNFKDHKGRFVGTGVYMVQFRMVVRYEKKKIEEEIKDKWGVRRKKKR